jgi:hypothetical protein
MSYVRTLLAKLGFEVDTGPLDEFNEGIDDSKSLLDQVKGRAGGLMDQLAKLNQVWELSSKVAGTAWSVLKGLTLEVSATGNAISDTSQQIGVGTTMLQRLQFAAESTGSSAETMTKVLQEQQKQLRETELNGATPFGKALDELGLKLADVQAMTAEQRLGVLGEHLAKVGDAGRRTALSLALFGSEGAKMLPTVIGGTEALRAMGDEGERLGYVMSEETIGSAAELEATFKGVSQTVQGVKNDIAAALMPTIAKLAGEMSAWISQNKKLIAENVKGFIDGMISAGKTLGPVIMTAAKAVMGLVDALGGADKVIGPVTAGLGAMKLAAMASLGPWGLLAGAAVTAGVAIVNWMGKATKSTLDANRAAMRLTETLRFEAHLEEMSIQDLEKKKAEIAAARERNKVLQGDVRGLSPKEILRREAERKADIEMLENNEQALEKVLGRKKGETKRASDSKYAEAADARKAADDKAREEQDKASQGIADTEELRYLRRKKGKTKADRERIKELEKATGSTGGGARKGGDKQASADELVLAASGREGGGILGATQAPGAGTTVNNINITLAPVNHIGPFTIPPYAITNAESFGRSAGATAAAELDRQNAEAGAYFSTGRSGKR